MKYDRAILGYHGCDAAVADELIAGKPFRKSENDYDWLGWGVYFWEYGHDRAMRFAEFQKSRGVVKTPAVVGAFIRLGNCFDLLDTRHTAALAEAYPFFVKASRKNNVTLPQNAGKTPDKKLRKRDCAVLNFYLKLLEELDDPVAAKYDTVRCAFAEGNPAFPGSKIRLESHIQVAVRNPDCIVGTFRPMIGGI